MNNFGNHRKPFCGSLCLCVVTKLYASFLIGDVSLDRDSMCADSVIAMELGRSTRSPTL